MLNKQDILELLKETSNTSFVMAIHYEGFVGVGFRKKRLVPGHGGGFLHRLGQGRRKCAEKSLSQGFAALKTLGFWTLHTLQPVLY